MTRALAGGLSTDVFAKPRRLVFGPIESSVAACRHFIWLSRARGAASANSAPFSNGVLAYAVAAVRSSASGYSTNASRNSAGTYKIPTANDIPVDMRVTLLKDAPNPRTPLAHSSKAVGEPPLFLGAAVFFALKVRNEPESRKPQPGSDMMYSQSHR